MEARKSCGYLMDYLANQILAFIKDHPESAAFVIGITAFGESCVFLSLVFPGTAILIASGTLIEAGILDPTSPIVAGIVGAVFGDAISYWLGQKFGPFLPKIWPFRTHPEQPRAGHALFPALWRKQCLHRTVFRPSTRDRSIGGGYVAYAAVTLLYGQYLIRDSLGAGTRAFR